MGVAKRTVLLSILGGATVSTTLSNMGPARKEGTTHSHPAKVVEARSLQGTVGTTSRIAPPRALPTNRQPANLSVIPYPHLPYATPLFTRVRTSHTPLHPPCPRPSAPPSVSQVPCDEASRLDDVPGLPERAARARRVQCGPPGVRHGRPPPLKRSANHAILCKGHPLTLHQRGHVAPPSHNNRHSIGETAPRVRVRVCLCVCVFVCVCVCACGRCPGSGVRSAPGCCERLLTPCPPHALPSPSAQMANFVAFCLFLPLAYMGNFARQLSVVFSILASRFCSFGIYFTVIRSREYNVAWSLDPLSACFDVPSVSVHTWRGAYLAHCLLRCACLAVRRVPEISTRGCPTAPIAP